MTAPTTKRRDILKTSSTFRRHKNLVKWEKGCFALPNKLVQNSDLTDSGFRLLSWMISCSDDWIVYQSDIMNRFEWGETKMRAALDNLIELKYLVNLGQQRKEGGGWGPCDYEFSAQGFTDEEIDGFKISSPYPDDRGSDDRGSDDQGTKQVPRETNPKETTTAKEKKPAVAVFLDEEKELGKKPLVYAVLETVDIPHPQKLKLTRIFDEETVTNAIGWATHPTNPPRKSLAASITYACNDGLSIAEFEKQTLSPYEMVRKYFDHDKTYNGARCTLNKDAISFTRTLKYEEVKFDKFFKWEKLIAMCKNFGIPFNPQEKK